MKRNHPSNLPDRIGRNDPDPRARAIWQAFDTGKPVYWSESTGTVTLPEKPARLPTARVIVKEPIVYAVTLLVLAVGALLWDLL